MTRIYSLLAFLICFILMISISSCTKEKITLTAQEISSPANNDLNDILFINDSIGFACGGEKYLSGTILKTVDAGQHWNVSLSNGPKAFYTMFYINQKIYCTGYDGFYFMSADSGTSWIEMNYPQYKRINQIFFTNNNKMYAAIGEGFDNGAIYQSNDAGASWSRKDTFVKVIKSIYFLDETTGFAGSYGSIYKTNNAGDTWEPTTADGDLFMKIQFCSPKIAYAIGYFGKILKTTDGGTVWKKILNENFQFNEKSNFNDAYFTDENTGYVVGNNGYIIKTIDGGNHWQQINEFTQEDLKAIEIKNHNASIVGSNGKIFLLHL